MKTNLRTLGPAEARVVLSLREQGREIVTTTEIAKILGSKKSAHNAVYKLLRKGWLTRLVGGRYMFLPPEHGPENTGENNALAVASAITEPSYVGWWAAASFHGFTTQKPMALSVAVLKQLPTRLVEGTEVRFVKVAPRKFFGFQNYAVYGRTAVISTTPKTVVDCVDRPDLAGGPGELTRIVFGASTEVDVAELMNTARQTKSTSLLQRLGFLMDLVGWSIPADQRQSIHDVIPKTARSVFGRRDRRHGDIGYVAQWKLLVHSTRDELLSDVPRNVIRVRAQPSK
jgi:predicted transcriptional regulator of viral defense system